MSPSSPFANIGPRQTIACSSLTRKPIDIAFIPNTSKGKNFPSSTLGSLSPMPSNVGTLGP